MRRHNVSLSYKITFSIVFVIFALYSLFLLYFFVFGFAIATKTNMSTFIMDQINNRTFSFSKPLNWHNFVQAFQEWNQISEYGGYLVMIWNGVWRAVGTTFVSVLTSSLVCYVICYYKCRFTKFIYNLGLFLAVLPIYGTAGAGYRLQVAFHLINTPLQLLNNITLFGGYFFFMIAFWKAISWEYAEAAFVDGAGHFLVYFKIMFPMFMPSMMALAVMSLIGCWNEYEGTIVYMYKYPTLAYGIYAYQEISTYNANTPAYFAGVLIALIPTLILFIAFQNSIMEKIYIGGLKG